MHLTSRWCSGVVASSDVPSALVVSCYGVYFNLCRLFHMRRNVLKLTTMETMHSALEANILFINGVFFFIYLRVYFIHVRVVYTENLRFDLKWNYYKVTENYKKC